jgi:ectoine hydroxylase-related dioxygenase (phytanoyl-CoA dioxygenase family)
MTKDADFKRVVRARAARTGESYEAALRQIRGADPGVHADAASLRAEFEEHGVVRLREVFSEDAAAAMREAVWRAWFDTYGITPEDRSTWSRAPAWKSLPRAKRDPIFRAVLGKQLNSTAGVLLGPGWTTSIGFGGLLASFPDSDTWRLPGREGIWHSDCMYATPMEPLPMLRIFALFGDVPAGGGGTLLVTGSHRMVAKFRAQQPERAVARAKEARFACHNSNAWLAELTHGDTTTPGRIERFMDEAADVEGIAARVIEASGRSGDVFVCHPWTIHCRGPNASRTPRFLRSPTLMRRDGTSAPPDGS